MANRTERSEQSEVPQRIPTKRPKSSILDEIQLKQKKDGNYFFFLQHKNKSYKSYSIY